MPLKLLSLKQGILFVVFLFLISLLGVKPYQGTFFHYIVFDISWLAVLLSAFCFSQSYVIFYVQIMLFLGFWLKLMAYLIVGIAFIEPTGYWNASDATSASWDHVLLISSLAACGILLANGLFFLCIKNAQEKRSGCTISQWYMNHHHFAWSFIFSIGVLFNLINIFYKIYVTGLQPQVILPFHLNRVFIWVMVIVIPFCMAAFLGWDQDLKQKQQHFYWICFLAFFTSLSILSRATYLFWTLPFLLILISQPDFSFKKLSLWKNQKIIFVYLTCALLSIIFVNMIRVNDYSVASPPSIEYKLEKHSAPHFQHVDQLKSLFIGRWVGMEAVMATTAFPHSGWDFFAKSLLEKPSVSHIGIYTQDVLKLNNFHNTKKTMFSSLPGLVGILNYANTPGVIFWGMLGICFLLCAIERIVFLILKNKFLLSQQGMILGYWCVSGLNVPCSGLINLLECFFVSLCLSLIGSCYNWVVRKRRRTKVMCAV